MAHRRRRSELQGPAAAATICHGPRRFQRRKPRSIRRDLSAWDTRRFALGLPRHGGIAARLFVVAESHRERGARSTSERHIGAAADPRRPSAAVCRPRARRARGRADRGGRPHAKSLQIDRIDWPKVATTQDRLRELGISLPAPPPPAASYVQTRLVPIGDGRSLLYIAG